MQNNNGNINCTWNANIRAAVKFANGMFNKNIK